VVTAARFLELTARTVGRLDGGKPNTAAVIVMDQKLRPAATKLRDPLE
jgi:hypothetical protein